jgi:hypothetical protein
MSGPLFLPTQRKSTTGHEQRIRLSADHDHWRGQREPLSPALRRPGRRSVLPGSEDYVRFPEHNLRRQLQQPGGNTVFSNDEAGVLGKKLVERSMDYNHRRYCGIRRAELVAVGGGLRLGERQAGIDGQRCHLLCATPLRGRPQFSGAAAISSIGSINGERQGGFGQRGGNAGVRVSVVHSTDREQYERGMRDLSMERARKASGSPRLRVERRVGGGGEDRYVRTCQQTC